MEAIGPTPLQDKIIAKIRDQLGELIEPDDIRVLLARTLDEAFTKPRTVQRSSYGGTDTFPPYMVEWLQTAAKVHVETVVTQWIADNPATLERLVKETIQDGIAGAMLAAVERRMSAPLMALGNAIMDTQQQLVSKGLISVNR
jgi:hypothetical protein